MDLVQLNLRWPLLRGVTGVQVVPAGEIPVRRWYRGWDEV